MNSNPTCDHARRRDQDEGAAAVFRKTPQQAFREMIRVDRPQRTVGGKRAPAELAAQLQRRLTNGQLLVAPQGNRSRGYRIAKRLFDLAGAAALLVALSPLLLGALALLVFTTRGRPFFVQRRVGYLGRTFPMLKFRTMRLDADRIQHLVANEKDGPIFKARRDPRITRIGRVLRKTSIDEMPQLVNVLLGHMSLVGPRPPVPKEVVHYELWQLRRLAIQPGLTCLWQVSGRSEIGFEDWVRMDVWYAQNQHLSTDIKLLALTPWSVITCRGAY
ncbi:MAG: sugar transferase [Pirellulales bacterium]